MLYTHTQNIYKTLTSYRNSWIFTAKVSYCSLWQIHTNTNSRMHTCPASLVITVFSANFNDTSMCVLCCHRLFVHFRATSPDILTSLAIWAHTRCEREKKWGAETEAELLRIKAAASEFGYEWWTCFELVSPVIHILLQFVWKYNSHM